MSTLKEIPKLSPEDVDYDDMYRDQGPIRSQYFDRSFFSYLLPPGIRMLDGEYGRLIRDEGEPGNDRIRLKRLLKILTFIRLL